MNSRTILLTAALLTTGTSPVLAQGWGWGPGPIPGYGMMGPRTMGSRMMNRGMMNRGMRGRRMQGRRMVQPRVVGPQNIGRPWVGLGMRGARNPLLHLIRNAEELKLDEDQITTLQAFADSLKAENAPDLETLEAARGPGNRGAIQSLQPVIQGIRSRTDAYLEKAKGILTEEQLPIADRLLERMGPRGRAGFGRPSPDG